MAQIIVYEVRASFGTVLFTNLEAAKNYRLECLMASPEPFPGLGPPPHPTIAPRIVLDHCANPELAVAS